MNKGGQDKTEEFSIEIGFNLDQVYERATLEYEKEGSEVDHRIEELEMSSDKEIV